MTLVEFCNNWFGIFAIRWRLTQLCCLCQLNYITSQFWGNWKIQSYTHTRTFEWILLCKMIEISMSTYFDQKWLRSGLFCSMSTSCNFLPPQDLRLGSCVPLFWAKTCQSCHICFSFDLPFMMINISSQREMLLEFGTKRAPLDFDIALNS